MAQESERLGGMGNDGHAQLPAQPAVPRMGDLDDLLCKLSTWDGSSGTAHDDSTSSDDNGVAIWPSGETTHLEMHAMKPQDVDVILQLSGAYPSSFAGVSLRRSRISQPDIVQNSHNNIR